MTLNEIHSLIAPYALDAIDADERARFEAHLEQCDECRTELAGFLATASRLGDVPAQTPPPELRAHLMEAVTHTAQERPIVTALASHGRLRRTLPRLAVAAAMVVAVGSLGAYAVEHQRKNDLQAQQAGMTEVLTAADAERFAAPLKSGGTLQMVESKSTGGAVLIASDLPALEGKTYQLWTMKGDEAHSEGLIGSKSSMKLVPDITDADTIAVTIEPAGGSKEPSSPPIASMPV
jgi:anti-sigma-K factor RskA